MKTLTKMKKVCCLSRFVLLVMALGMTSIFTSCSSDDDENIPVYSLKDVGEQIIETLNGKVKMKIKPETQNGTKVRLRGKGFPVYKQDGQFGDLFVTYEVKIPTHLTEKQKELFRELQNS